MWVGSHSHLLDLSISVPSLQQFDILKSLLIFNFLIISFEPVNLTPYNTNDFIDLRADKLILVLDG